MALPRFWRCARASAGESLNRTTLPPTTAVAYMTPAYAKAAIDTSDPAVHSRQGASSIRVMAGWHSGEIDGAIRRQIRVIPAVGDGGPTEVSGRRISCARWRTSTLDTRQTNPGVSDPQIPRVRSDARVSGGVAHVRVCVLSQLQTRMAGGTERRPVSSIPVAAILRARSSYRFLSGRCSSRWMRFEHARRPTVAEDDLHMVGRPEGRPRPYVRFGRIRFSPQLQLIEVFRGDLALTESFKKMVAERRR